MAEKQKKWDGKSRGGRTGYLIFAFILKHLGVGFAYCLLAFVVPYFIIFAPSQTTASWHYQRRRLHRVLLRSLVGLYSHYFNFGQALIDKMAMTAGAAGSFSFEYDNYDKALEIVGRHEGAIFIGAHIGNWEVASHFFGEYGKDISVVMYQNEDRDIKKLLEEMYGTLPFKPIAINVDPLGAMLEIKASLNSGGYVCSKCRVPVIFFYAMREKGRRYRFIFEEMPLGSFKGPDGLIDAYLNSLADKVKRYPMQWFNFYDFWED